MNKMTLKHVSFGIVFVLLLFLTETGLASFKRDPIEETQTRPIPVTEELLTREGELGPASPTYKMEGETANFLVKKPYEEAETEYLGELSNGEETSSLSDEWFFWDKEGQEMSETEAIDKK